MPVEKIHIEQFLELAKLHPVLDVRSPGEYLHAHMPGAHSLPLFSDEERKIVGTAYKQESREAAIKLGLDYFGPKMKRMVEEVESLFNKRPAVAGDPDPAGRRLSGIALVHCWRGGMRSAGVAWLLDLYGFKVYTLVGGYKFFRRFVLRQFEEPFDFKILGGYTGSGKTEVLKQLAKAGERVIDLEALANHKGSAFGNIGMPAQPSQEMFENLLAVKLYRAMVSDQRLAGSVANNGWPMSESRFVVERESSTTHSSVIWLEDESQRIGSVNLPQPFWLKMRSSPVYFMDIPFRERLKHIIEEYGRLDKEKMIAAVERIQKRLGGLETKTTIRLLGEEKTEDAFRILLKYYDKWYLKGLHNREKAEELSTRIELSGLNAIENARMLIQAIKKQSNQKKIVDEPGYG